MIILGVDPGLQVAGYCLAAQIQGKSRMIEAGVLNLKPKDSLTKRVRIFHDFIEQKIKDNHVTAISLETPFLGRNSQSFLKLGYLRGILYLLADKYDLPIYEFAPTQVKQAVTGYGSASKDQVQLMIKRLFNAQIDFASYDASDAVAIALCGLWQSQCHISLKK
jgi:crossover junction endodeoxyribonuclease RuvC